MIKQLFYRANRNNVVKYLYYEYENEFKLLKTWRYSWWNVYFYECPKCGGGFRYQVDPESRRKSFIIKTGFSREEVTRMGTLNLFTPLNLLLPSMSMS
jgi:hypothetical protein